MSYGDLGQVTFSTQNRVSIPATITIEPGALRASGRVYKIIDKDSKILGQMSTFVNYFVSAEFGASLDEVGPENGWIEIERLDNFTKNDADKVKGIGKALVEYAVAQSIQLGLKGRVHTDSVGDSHFFYWSQGFRPLRNIVFAMQEARKIYKLMQSQKPLTPFLEECYYNLKLSAIERTGKTEGELTLNDICYMDLSKRMQDMYDEALSKNEHAHFGDTSLLMHLPPTSIEGIHKIHSSQSPQATK